MLYHAIIFLRTEFSLRMVFRMSQQEMSQQEMMQFPDRPRRRLSRYIITFAIFTFVCYVISCIIYVLQIYNIIHGPWIMPLFAVFTGLGTTAGIPAAVL